MTQITADLSAKRVPNYWARILEKLGVAMETAFLAKSARDASSFRKCHRHPMRYAAAWLLRAIIFQKPSNPNTEGEIVDDGQVLYPSTPFSID